MQDPTDAAHRPTLHELHHSLEAQIREFEALLAGDFVDLSRLGGEIHARPELESLALRLTIALGLGAEGCPPTAEESIVLLGTNRLRALIYVWFLIQCNQASSAIPEEVLERLRIASPKALVKEVDQERRSSCAESAAKSNDDLLKHLLELLGGSS
jgi:hypothetical protein